MYCISSHSSAFGNVTTKFSEYETRILSDSNWDKVISLKKNVYTRFYVSDDVRILYISLFNTLQSIFVAKQFQKPVAWATEESS